MKKIKEFLKNIKNLLGPGFITGASDDDPSGIATYSQTGAQFGYSLIWLSLFTYPLMAVIQEMCGRIGIVTGKGIAGVLRKYYPKYLLYFCISLLIVANTINIGADLGAMAVSLQMLTGLSIEFLLLMVTVFTLSLQIIVPYQIYARYLKFLAFALLAYIMTAFLVKQDWPNVLHSLVIPSIQYNSAYLLTIVAILGTTISPYLFFWQADEEVEEEVATHKLRFMGAGIPKIHSKDIKDMRLDTITGMFFSNIVMFFIILTTASTLHANGLTDIQTAPQAAAALKPLAGDFAYLLFAMGIIGTGLLTVPILAGSASYAVSEALKWRTGLGNRIDRAKGFYGVIIVSVLIGSLINIFQIDPIKALYFTAVLNGIIAPPLIFMIVAIANNKKVMGKYHNKPLVTITGIGAGIIMTGAVLAVFADLLGLLPF